MSHLKQGTKNRTRQGGARRGPSAPCLPQTQTGPRPAASLCALRGQGPLPPPRAWPGAVHMPGPGQGLRPAPRRCCALWFSLLGLFFDCSSGRTLARSSPQEHPVILRSEEQQVHRAAGGPCAGSRVCHQHLQRSLSLYDDAVCSEASLLVLFSLNELAFI